MLHNKKGQKQVFPQHSFLEKNCKAQVGETLTWIVATLIIIFILVAFVYASVLMGKAKALNPQKLSIKFAETQAEISWVEMKTIFAYSLNDENKNKIETWIGEDLDEE